jgi:predicted GH43/DUF377 family glycosyl hydrolase
MLVEHTAYKKATQWVAFFVSGCWALLMMRPALAVDALDGWQWRAIGQPAVFTKLISLEEDRAIGPPDVVRDDDGSYVMVYAQGGTDSKGRIGMARSADGVAWTRVNPTGTILSPSVSGWDSHFLDTPTLLKHQNMWYLWYFGDDNNEAIGASIGLAVSSDGIHFEKYAHNPVLMRGLHGTWDALWVESPAVVHDGTQFVMYYTGVGENWLPQVGRATSPDGVHWQKEERNPVLHGGDVTAWDGFAVAVPDVVLRDGVWQMFYAGLSVADMQAGKKSPNIGVATSMDGVNWQRSTHNPIIDAAMIGYLPNAPYNPSVLWDDAQQRYMVWYETGIGFGLVTGSHK